ncbi:MAG: nuclear transport factor 2 family protein [Actinobacteria bacterium]|nr:nuclear transport factor 2 family protein [Actinomycetota bacterium]
MTPADLVEIAAIERLKYAYFRCLDLKQWDDIAELFVPEATCAYSAGAYSYDGRDAIVGFFRKAMGRETFLSSHKAHHPEIALTGPDSATGVWALEDWVIDTQWNLDIRGAAFYEDDYVKRDGKWLILRTAYKRVFEEIVPRSEKAQLTASWWGTGGRSSLPAPE